MEQNERFLAELKRLPELARCPPGLTRTFLVH